MQTLKELLQKYASQHDVVVLGGGVSGITTAIVLQSVGYKPIIFTDYASHEEGGPKPLVPSDYAMASAYPHELRIADFERITYDSQLAFAHLRSVAWSGVSLYRMFEVFEQEPVLPHSLGRRLKLCTFDGSPQSLKGSIDPPVRKGVNQLWGWRFETFFVDMPRYIPLLRKLFSNRGGVVHHTRIDELPRTDLPVVNCLGVGAIEVVGDNSPANIMRGKQVIVPAARPVQDADGMPLCYNYTPTPEVYARADGTAEYVHFFPRAADWVLGQTREPGELNADGRWVGKEVRSASPIVELNADILNNWKGLSFSESVFNKREGYRYYRDPAGSGVRLEAEENGSSLIVHNYGHGGSGVTVSWGCAIKCAQILLDKTRPSGVVPLRSVQARLQWIFGR